MYPASWQATDEQGTARSSLLSARRGGNASTSVGLLEPSATAAAARALFPAHRRNYTSIGLKAHAQASERYLRAPKSHPHPQPSSGRREMGRLNCTKDTATVHTPRGVIRASAGDDVSSENGQEQPIHEALPRVRKTGPGPYHSARLGPTRSPPLRLQHRDTASWPARHQTQVRARATPLRCLSFFHHDVGQGLIVDVQC